MKAKSGHEGERMFRLKRYKEQKQDQGKFEGYTGNREQVCLVWHIKSRVVEDEADEVYRA